MTQRISDHNLLASILCVHDPDRLGKVSPEEVAHILSAYVDDEDSVAEQDLLSLRAAVRRVRDARKATSGQAVCMPLEVVQALDALDAEMASLDGDGGAS